MFSWFKKLFKKEKEKSEGFLCTVVIRRINRFKGWTEEVLYKTIYGGHEYGKGNTNLDEDYFTWVGYANTMEEAVLFAKGEWEAIKSIMHKKREELAPIIAEKKTKQG